MEEIRYGGGELFLHCATDDGSEDGFQEPGNEGEFRFAEREVEFVDMDADCFEGEDVFEFFTADFHVEGDVDAAVVELEAGDALICEAEDSGVGAEPEADVVGSERHAVEADGD